MNAGDFLVKYLQTLLSLSPRMLFLVEIGFRYNMKWEDFVSFCLIAKGWPIEAIQTGGEHER